MTTLAELITRAEAIQGIGTRVDEALALIKNQVQARQVRDGWWEVGRALVNPKTVICQNCDDDDAPVTPTGKKVCRHYLTALFKQQETKESIEKLRLIIDNCKLLSADNKFVLRCTVIYNTSWVTIKGYFVSGDKWIILQDRNSIITISDDDLQKVLAETGCRLAEKSNKRAGMDHDITVFMLSEKSILERAVNIAGLRNSHSGYDQERLRENQLRSKFDNDLAAWRV